MTNSTEVAGHTYRIGRLNARQQLHVARKLTATPISGLIGAVTGDSAVSEAVRERATASGITVDEMHNMLPKLMPSLLLRSLSMLSPPDCDFIIDTCMMVCSRKEGDRYVSIWNAGAGQMQFQDIELPTMLDLTVKVLEENLGSFFAESLLISPARPTTTPQQ